MRKAFARLSIGRSALYLALLAGAVVTLFPFVWMVSTSLTDDFSLFRTPPRLVPSPVQGGNYSRVAELMPIWRFVANSFGVAIASTLLQLATAAMGAYAFARLRFPGRDALFVVYLTTLMVPFQV